MSVSVQRRGQGWQVRVIHRLLPRPFFHTFTTSEAEARAYGRQLHDLLDSGVVPAELAAPPARHRDDALLVAVVRAYLNAAPGLTASDAALLTTIVDRHEIDGLRVSGVSARWAETYVARLKRRRLTPGTIRKRVGALGRVLDWHLRRDHGAGEGRAVLNPLRAMPPGYSIYTDADIRAAGLEEAPRDQERDRRLLPDEETRIRRALAGEKRPDRERALQVDPALVLLFDLVLDTGLRLSEAFRLRVDQVDLQRRVLRVEGSKGRRGMNKPRVVPLKPGLVVALTAWCKNRIGLVFPFWDGTVTDKARASRRLSQRFRVVLDYAKVANFTEHDLRHEATCRWFELRDPDGRWLFSDIEVARIMGWSSLAMALRYASIRGEDLAARLGSAV